MEEGKRKMEEGDEDNWMGSHGYASYGWRHIDFCSFHAMQCKPCYVTNISRYIGGVGNNSEKGSRK